LLTKGSDIAEKSPYRNIIKDPSIGFKNGKIFEAISPQYYIITLIPTHGNKNA
jgi:hypothetical protein